MSEPDAVANDGDLEFGRTCYAQQRWAEAFEAFLRAERRGPIPVDDLSRLAWSAALVGNNEEFIHALARLHQACVLTHDRRLTLGLLPREQPDSRPARFRLDP